MSETTETTRKASTDFHVCLEPEREVPDYNVAEEVIREELDVRDDDEVVIGGVEHDSTDLFDEGATFIEGEWIRELGGDDSKGEVGRTKTLKIDTDAILDALTSERGKETHTSARREDNDVVPAEDDPDPLSSEQWYRSETLFDAHTRIARDIEKKDQSAEGYELGQRAALNIIETMILEVPTDDR